MPNKKYHHKTELIRKKPSSDVFQEQSAALFMTSSFEFNSASEIADTFSGEEDHFIYSRYANPNLQDLIEKMSLTEGMETGFATASGMSAIYTTLASLLKPGDHVICTESVFGSTYQLFTDYFPSRSIDSTFLPMVEMDKWEALVRPNTKVLFIETPSNPSLQLVDLKAACQFGTDRGLITIVDNCFSTPIVQQPAEFGADIVLHSATKFIDGQGRALGGLILTSEEIAERVQFLIRHSGPVMSPYHAWLFSKSLETLDLRMTGHCSNALYLATELSNHPKVKKAIYPFLKSHPQYDLAITQMKMGGGILTLDLKTDQNGCFRFIDALELFTITSNLGNVKSIATHPASTTHSKLSEENRRKMGITDSMVRLSIGLEDRNDLLSDLSQALELC